MKPLYLIVALLFSIGSFAQDSSNTSVKAPKIITKLPIHKTAFVNDVEFTFLKLVSDSRCPKGVNCIWAGEVELLVKVKHGDREAEEKLITIGFKRQPTGDETSIIFKNDAFTIKALTVSPYPEHGVAIEPSAYKLHFDVLKL